jgi:hypothetical protein
VKNGAVLLTRTGRGIRPLYETAVAPENNGILGGAALADKVIGKAAPCSACTAGEIRVRRLMSEPAAAVLTASGIPFEYRQ